MLLPSYWQVWFASSSLPDQQKEKECFYPVMGKGKVCNKCGDKGYDEALVTCSQCKIISEHQYCTVTCPTVSDPWICETCEESKQKMQPPSKSLPLSKTKESAKVKFISAEEVASLALGCQTPVSSTRGCLGASVLRTGDMLKKPSFTSKNMSSRSIATTALHGYSEKKTSHISVPPALQSLRVDGEASQRSSLTKKSKNVLATLKPSSIKSQLPRSDSRCNLQGSSLHMNDEHLKPPDKALGLCMDIQCGEFDFQRNGPSSALLIVPNEDEIQWKGQFLIKDVAVHTYEDIRACFPQKISMKAYNASKSLPEKLQFRLINRLDIWPKIFLLNPPFCDDAAMYFLPSESDRLKEKYIRLLERMNKHDLAMHCQLDGFELLIYTSKLLALDSQKLNTNQYLWGIFRHRRRKKTNQEAGVPGEGNSAEADMEIDMKGGNVGKLDKRIVKPPVMQNNHEEQNTPSVPPGFSEQRNGESGFEEKPSVKFALKKPVSHTVSYAPPSFCGPFSLKHGSGSSENTGKSLVPQMYDKGHPASCATRGEDIISSSNTEKGKSRCHQVPLIVDGSRAGKAISHGEVSRQRDSAKKISPALAGYESPESLSQTGSTLSLFPESEVSEGNAVEHRNRGKNPCHGVSHPVQPVSPDLSISRPQYINDGRRWIPAASRDRLSKDDCGKEIRLTL